MVVYIKRTKAEQLLLKWIVCILSDEMIGATTKKNKIYVYDLMIQ